MADFFAFPMIDEASLWALYWLITDAAAPVNIDVSHPLKASAAIPNAVLFKFPLRLNFGLLELQLFRELSFWQELPYMLILTSVPFQMEFETKL